MEFQHDAHQRSAALLQGEKNITEMIARGNLLEPILEGSCRLVEQALPGWLGLSCCWMASDCGV